MKSCDGSIRSVYKNIEDQSKRTDGTYFCKYCGQGTFKFKSDLKKHYNACEVKKSLPKDSIGRVKNIETTKLTKDRNLEKYTCRFCGRIAKTIYGNTNHQCFCEKNPNHITRKGSPCTDWNRLHQAEIARARMDVIGCPINYNKSACEYLNKLNEEKGWNLQHALNGGEIQVGPYYIDGYDAQNNIAVEYNEAAHYVNDSKIEHDRKRAEYIHSILNCQFYVYNEPKNILEKWY